MARLVRPAPHPSRCDAGFHHGLLARARRKSTGASPIARLLTALATATLLAGVPAHATTLAIIRTPDQVVIAADSLLVWYGGDRRPQLTCKLDSRDDVIFGMAGLVVSPENDFDVRTLVTMVLGTPGPLEERALVLERLIRGRLLGTLTRIRHELPQLFAEQLESGFVLNVTLAAVRDQIARLEMRDFYAETAPDGTLQLRVARVSCPRDCPRPTEVFGVGETAAMMQHLGTLPQFPAGLPGLAKRLVEIEIAARPALVGPPVDVLRVGVMVPPTMAAAEQPSEPGIDTWTMLRSMATLVPRGLGVAIAVALLVGVLVELRRRSKNRRTGEGQPRGVDLAWILGPVMPLAVVAALTGSYALVFILPDTTQAPREAVADMNADTSGVEWLQRKPACAG